MNSERNQQAAGSGQQAATNPLHGAACQPPPASRRLLLAAACLLLLVGCRQQMADQPRYKPLAKSAFFGDGRSARPLVPGTVPRGHLNADQRFFSGKSLGELVTTLPIPLTKELLQRGQDRFNIFCAPCHDRTGSGQGMIVQRGYRRPPSFHLDRLREVPIGHFFDVAMNGFGSMPNYSEQVPPADRWAIAAYIRALQFSQNATLADVSVEAQQQLREKTP